MEMNISYTGGMRFDAQTRTHTIIVDQPKEGGGQDTGPTPPELFVASLGTCIGVYALWFCQKRKIPYEGMKVSIDWSKSTTPPARVDLIEAKIELPQGCPAEHKAHLIESVEKCMVHNSIIQAPEITITV
ncbi:MAG TPA: OsmC family protein [Planctomycetota bacterium]|nr:OsmC family protein [Planctomycetota bacterium]